MELKPSRPSFNGPELAAVQHQTAIERMLRSRARLHPQGWRRDPPRKEAAEGGCGVIGIASSVQIEGRHLLQSLMQMRNRGNGKGGGAAIAGLDPSALGVSAELLRQDYLLTLAYLERSAADQIEPEIAKAFELHHSHRFPVRAPLKPDPPEVRAYFVAPRVERLDQFRAQHALEAVEPAALADEYMYQFSVRLNDAYYAPLAEKRAFVLSHGKDLLVLKLVGFGDDVFRAYGLEDLRAHVWIGHHRYPTKGTVWHPGGAHPFIGLHEALVHNGDFANYASVCSYLAQHNIRPQFLTDTEVSVQVFDLLHRTFGYPIEYVIEALAPTTERDFAMLPPEKRRIYARLQSAHMHGSPDGPWFFLLAQSLANGDGPRLARLLGITDTSMLRPQVFALQEGPQAAIGLAASEKQAIDAALSSLAEADARFGTRADRIWNARGGSHTDGGAFLFTVERPADGPPRLVCQDKFGRIIRVEEPAEPYRGPIALGNEGAGSGSQAAASSPRAAAAEPAPARERGEAVTATGAERVEQLYADAVEQLPQWGYDDLQAYLGRLLGGSLSRTDQLALLSLLMDRRYPSGRLRRSSLLEMLDLATLEWAQAIERQPDSAFQFHRHAGLLPKPAGAEACLVVDADGFPAQGPGSLALELRDAVRRGFRRIVAVRVRGQRFIANGLGGATDGVRIELFGSTGDYLASGIDGAEVVVHGSAQDQLAQIMKSGRLIVHGDVGQTFMYGAKGGEAFVLGNAAGRPLINAVGRPRVVINGTCLDYLAESFMAGDPLADGGYVILNGVAFDARGELVDLETPYPGGNLFSLASGGAIFVRDPHQVLGEDQLNGGKFIRFDARHWKLIEPMLVENQRHFGIPVERLLRTSDGPRDPESVYRMIVPTGHKALQPEQAWVRHPLD